MITLQKFRIRNYKSIVDSGDCYLSDNITIFAGKNESGKSSILEALEDFHEDKEIRAEAVPIEDDELKPEISATFSVDTEDINEILNKIGEGRGVMTSTIDVELTKNFPKQYTLSNETVKLLNLSNTPEDKKLEILDKTSILLQEINQIIAQNPRFGARLTFPIKEATDLAEIENIKSQILNFNTQAAPLLPRIVDDAQRGRVSSIPNEIISLIDSGSIEGNEVSQFLEEFINKKLPYFVLYSSFDDIFPDSINKTELSENVWAKDLETISNFNISKITSSDPQQRRNHAETTNVEFSEVFKQYWTQADICLEVHPDDNNVYFYIKDNVSTRSYKPAQRSKGQQWYLGFYTKVVARIRDDSPNIILIDEPGLYLHAKAQKDLLKALEKHAKEKGATILFSTHSPYLIDDNELERVRLVENQPKKGTLITGKLHAHPMATKETLTPLLTAIGLGVNDGIGSLNKFSVIVEGASDAFYLRAFSKLISNDRYSFVNGGGSGNMPFVGAIAQGWGSKVIYLFDNDQGKSDGEHNLSKNWLVLGDEIQAITSSKGSIEDIFSKDDFKNLVLDDESLDYKSSNSEYVKRSKRDKVLLSRLFLQNTNEITLDTTTTKNVNDLFSSLEKKFKLMEPGAE